MQQSINKLVLTCLPSNKDVTKLNTDDETDGDKLSVMQHSESKSGIFNNNSSSQSKFNVNKNETPKYKRLESPISTRKPISRDISKDKQIVKSRDVSRDISRDKDFNNNI